MLTRITTALALGCLFWIAPSVEAQFQKGPRGGNAGRYGWLFSLDAGKELARKTGKPLMVVIRCEP